MVCLTRPRYATKFCDAQETLPLRPSAMTATDLSGSVPDPLAPALSRSARGEGSRPIGFPEQPCRRDALDRLARSTAAKYGRNGSQQDLQIEPQGPVVDVLQVKGHPLIKVDLIAPRDLP